jgi:hypothetical protein
MTTIGSPLSSHWAGCGTGIVPERCYRDAHAGITMLARAFGVTPALIVPEAEGSPANPVAHAELWAGMGCAMIARLGRARACTVADCEGTRGISAPTGRGRPADDGVR